MFLPNEIYVPFKSNLRDNQLDRLRELSVNLKVPISWLIRAAIDCYLDLVAEEGVPINFPPLAFWELKRLEDSELSDEEADELDGK